MSDDDPTLTSAAHAQRAVMVGTALVALLRIDPRVARVYADWRARHELDALGLRPDAADLRRAVFRDVERDLAALITFCRDELYVPYYRWLANALLADFGARVQGELTGEDVPIVLELDRDALPADLRPGRVRADSDYLIRDVWWYYRVTIKRPPDKPHHIAKEWAIDQQLSDSRMVYGVIDRVAALLALLDPTDPR